MGVEDQFQLVDWDRTGRKKFSYLLRKSSQFRIFKVRSRAGRFWPRSSTGYPPDRPRYGRTGSGGEQQPTRKRSGNPGRYAVAMHTSKLAP